MRHVVALILLFAAGFGVVRAATTQDSCKPKEVLLASLQRADAAYRPAMQLEAILQSHGIVVQCVLQSKMARFLPGQLGASLFRTDHGDFEALFRPDKQSFDDIRITDSRVRGLYEYFFRDAQGQLLRRMEGGPVFFVKHGNTLFVCYNEATPAVLTRALE